MQAGRKRHQAAHGLFSAPKDSMLPSLDINIEKLPAIAPLACELDITIPANYMSIMEEDGELMDFDIDIDELLSDMPEGKPGEINNMPNILQGAAGAAPRDQHMNLAPVQHRQQQMQPGAAQQPLMHQFLPNKYHPHPNQQQLANPAHAPFSDVTTSRALPRSTDQQQTFPFTDTPQQLLNDPFSHPMLTTTDTPFAHSTQSTIASGPFGSFNHSIPPFAQPHNLQHVQKHQQQALLQAQAQLQAQEQHILLQMQIQQQLAQQQQMLQEEESLAQQDCSMSGSLQAPPDLLSALTNEVLLQQLTAEDLVALQNSLLMQQPMPAAAAALSGMGGPPAGLSAAQQLQLSLAALHGGGGGGADLLQQNPCMLQLLQEELPLLQPGGEAAEVQGGIMEGLIPQQLDQPPPAEPVPAARRSAATRSKASSRTKAAAAAAAAAASVDWMDDAPFAPSSSPQQQQQQQQPAKAPSRPRKPSSSGANSSGGNSSAANSSGAAQRPSNTHLPRAATSHLPPPLLVMDKRAGDSARQIALNLNRKSAALQNQVTRRKVSLGAAVLNYLQSEEVLAGGEGARASHAINCIVRNVKLASEALACHAMSPADKLLSYIPPAATSPEQWGEQNIDRLLVTVACMLEEALAQGQAELVEVLRCCVDSIGQDLEAYGMGHKMPAALAEAAQRAGAAVAQQQYLWEGVVVEGVDAVAHVAVVEQPPAAAAGQEIRRPSIHSPPAPHKPRVSSAGGQASGGAAAAGLLASPLLGDAFSAWDAMQLSIGRGKSPTGRLAGSRGHTPQPGSRPSSGRPRRNTSNSGGAASSSYCGDIGGGSDCNGDSDCEGPVDDDDDDEFVSGGGGGPDKRTTNITLQRLQELYEVSIERAAKKLSIGVTMLKKYCRKYKIHRWPYRKLRSIDKLIDSIKEYGATRPECGYSEVVKQLRSFKDRVYEDPNEDIDDRIKKLRQANFKLEYKQRAGGAPAGGKAADDAVSGADILAELLRQT